MRPPLALSLALVIVAGPVAAADVPGPKAAEGWTIAPIVQSPAIAYPTAVVAAPDGTIYLGQDPMDMPGPPTSPIDSVVAIRDGRVSTFADGLWSVMGLEWSGGTLYVVHAPFLSAFRDLDGDGRAEDRVDLVTGLGPKVPGFNGINDHVASGIRLGMDGFLYVSVGDKGIPRGVGRDGRAIAMKTGGVIRVRPDGSDLEVVSTGERNPLSVALTASDDVFTYGNDDDSKKWPNSLTHHVVGGHHGYPYEFLTAPGRALPIVAGQFGGSGAQGICYNEDGLPGRFRGNLFFCDWGQQAVHRYEVAPSGGTFRLVRREPLVQKGTLDDFRPFSIATGSDGASLLVVDWAFNGWLVDGPKAGRLYRLTYDGPDRVEPALRPRGSGVEGLASGSHSARLDAHRRLAATGPREVGPLSEFLGRATGPGQGRAHALWALDAIGTPEARRAIRSALRDRDRTVRLQAARSCGIRRDREARAGLSASILDPEPAVRREAAIALGRLGDSAAVPGLYAALGDPDVFAAWSIRGAIRSLGAWEVAPLQAALADPKRREDALKLADESWSVPAARALGLAVRGPGDPAWRARVVETLGGLYRRYPEWSGRWFGTNPLAGAMPRKTEDWDRSGMDTVLAGLAAGLRDPEAEVRRRAIVALFGVGERAAPLLRAALPAEEDPASVVGLAEALGALGDVTSAPLLARILADPARPVEARVAALDALAALNSPIALRARLAVAYDAASPGELVARALPGLGRGRILPTNDLAGFLESPSEAVRAAALGSFPVGRPLPEEVRTAVVTRLGDASPSVRSAAIAAAGRHRVAEAVPGLVAMAADEPHRADATQALALMPDPRGVPAFLAALKDRDPELRKAGETALLEIRDLARDELEAEARRGSFVGPSALAVERILARFRPVPSWRVVGPFPRTTAASFEDSSAIDFARSLPGAEGRPVSWRGREAEPATGRTVIDDLKGGAGDRGGFGYDEAGSPDLAAFAVADVESDRDRAALLLVGSSGPIWVAINDRPVLNLAGASGRPYAPDSNQVRVGLRRGSNRILIRTRQGAGTWAFGVQVSEPSAAGAASPNTEGLRAFALSHRGDPRNGEAIFHDPRGVGCVRCHAVGGRGPAGIGPDLAGLASKSDKAEVIRSILEPSARIAPGHRPTVVARRDGTVVAGVLRAETEAHLELVDDRAATVRVPLAEVESRHPGEVSTMPAGLVDGLSPGEFADLVSFLMTLDATPGGSRPEPAP